MTPHDHALRGEVTFTTIFDMSQAQIVARLSLKVGEYMLLMEENMAKVRYLPNLTNIYDSALEDWEADGLVMPPPEDEAKRKAYFEFCDDICRCNPFFPHEYAAILISMLAKC